MSKHQQSITRPAKNEDSQPMGRHAIFEKQYLLLYFYY